MSLYSSALYFMYEFFWCKWLMYFLSQISTLISTSNVGLDTSLEGKTVGAKSNLMDRHIKSQQIDPGFILKVFSLLPDTETRCFLLIRHIWIILCVALTYLSQNQTESRKASFTSPANRRACTPFWKQGACLCILELGTYKYLPHLGPSFPPLAQLLLVSLADIL